MSPIRSFISLSIVLGLFSSVTAQTPERYYGKLHALSADAAHIYQSVFSSPPADVRFRFSPAIEKGAVVSRSELIDDRTAAGKLEVLLVESPGKVPYLCFVDSDGDGVIENAKRFELKPAPSSPNGLDASLLLPIDNVQFKPSPSTCGTNMVMVHGVPEGSTAGRRCMTVSFVTYPPPRATPHIAHA